MHLTLSPTHLHHSSFTSGREGWQPKPPYTLYSIRGYTLSTRGEGPIFGTYLTPPSTLLHGRAHGALPPYLLITPPPRGGCFIITFTILSCSSTHSGLPTYAHNKISPWPTLTISTLGERGCDAAMPCSAELACSLHRSGLHCIAFVHSTALRLRPPHRCIVLVACSYILILSRAELSEV